MPITLDLGTSVLLAVTALASGGVLWYHGVRGRRAAEQSLALARTAQQVCERENDSLRVRLAKTQGFAKVVADAVAVIEQDGRLIPASAAFEQLAGPRESLTSAQLLAPAHHEEFEFRLQLLRSGASEVETLECALEPAAPDGPVQWVKLVLLAVQDGASRTIWLRASDCTVIRELTLMRDTSAAALATISEAVVVLNGDTEDVLWANQAFEALTGWPVNEATGRNLSDVLKSQPVDDAMPSILELVASGGRWEGEFRSVTAAGEVLVERRRVSLVEDEVGHATRQVVVFKDLTQDLLTHEHLQVLYQVDVATELPNLYGFLAGLRTKLAEQEHGRLSVVHLDFHGCEALREPQGSLAVDVALRRVAVKLSKSIRDDKLLSRVGPAQLAFMLPTVNMQAIEQVLRAVIAMLQSESKQAQDDLYTAVSIGVAPGGEGVSPENLLHAAQLTSARLDAKANVNLGYFSEQLRTETIRRLAVETALRETLRDHPEELVLHYQPKVNPHRQTLVGFEGLCRWKSKTLGQVSPLEFIAAAERTGLIFALGERTFEYACQTLADWRSKGLKLRPVAVNVSAHQLTRESLAAEFLAIAAKYDIAPRLLELEVTESAIMDDIESAARLLKKLRSVGFAIALDDFGTGQSSLAYLRTLPLDALKIDRSFISDIEFKSDAAAICKSILELGRTLHLKVIAEGVETPGQLEFLMERQCDVIQGHVFSPAVPADQAADMLLEMADSASTVMGLLDGQSPK